MRVSHAAVGLAVVLALAGCQRTSFGGFGSQDVPRSPAPLQAQPVPTVSAGQLPPPAGASQFPAPPTAGTGAPG
ncbi:hypothetical protein BMJ31_29900, partial [Sinorhizobium medicae]